MKFLCVECNEPMKLIKKEAAVVPSDKGSLTVRFECPSCLYEIAMLTNPFETQLVTSLGVRIGGQTVEGSTAKLEDSMQALSGTASAPQVSVNMGKCPFSKDIQKMISAAGDAAAMPWTSQAAVRMEKMPEFVRPMARSGIEKYARDKGFSEINEAVLDEAKNVFGM